MRRSLIVGVSLLALLGVLWGGWYWYSSRFSDKEYLAARMEALSAKAASEKAWKESNATAELAKKLRSESVQAQSLARDAQNRASRAEATVTKPGVLTMFQTARQRAEKRDFLAAQAEEAREAAYLSELIANRTAEDAVYGFKGATQAQVVWASLDRAANYTRFLSEARQELARIEGSLKAVVRKKDKAKKQARKAATNAAKASRMAEARHTAMEKAKADLAAAGATKLAAEHDLERALLEEAQRTRDREAEAARHQDYHNKSTSSPPSGIMSQILRVLPFGWGGVGDGGHEKTKEAMRALEDARSEVGAAAAKLKKAIAAAIAAQESFANVTALAERWEGKWVDASGEARALQEDVVMLQSALEKRAYDVRVARAEAGEEVAKAAKLAAERREWALGEQMRFEANTGRLEFAREYGLGGRKGAEDGGKDGARGWASGKGGVKSDVSDVIKTLQGRLKNVTDELQAKLHNVTSELGNVTSQLGNVTSQLGNTTTALSNTTQALQNSTQRENATHVRALEAEERRLLAERMREVYANESQQCLVNATIKEQALQELLNATSERTLKLELAHKKNITRLARQKKKVDELLRHYETMLPPSWIGIRRIAKAIWRVVTVEVVNSWRTIFVVVLFILTSAPFFRPLGRSQAFTDWLLGTIGADAFIFMMMFTTFLMGRWSWSFAWLGFTIGFASKRIKSRRKQATLRVGRIAHKLPLKAFTGKGGTMIKLKLTVSSGEVLIAMDANGLADPFVIVEFGVREEDPIKKQQKSMLGQMVGISSNVVTNTAGMGIGGAKGVFSGVKNILGGGKKDSEEEDEEDLDPEEESPGGSKCDKREKTTVKKGTMTPLWEEAFEWTTKDSGSLIKFTVMDWDVATDDDEIGTFKVKVAEVLKRVQEGQEYKQSYSARLGSMGRPRAQITLKWSFELRQFGRPASLAMSTDGLGLREEGASRAGSTGGSFGSFLSSKKGVKSKSKSQRRLAKLLASQNVTAKGGSGDQQAGKAGAGDKTTAKNLELPDHIVSVLLEGERMAGRLMQWAPSVASKVTEYKILERNVHLVVITFVVFFLGWLRFDVGFLIPLTALLGKLEAVHLFRICNVAKQRLYPTEDIRVTAARAWQNTYVPDENMVPEELLWTLFQRFRERIPHVLCDSEVSWLNGLLRHFWVIYGRWASAFLTDLIDGFVADFGIKVEDVTLGPNPLQASDACGLRGGEGCLPKPKDKLEVTLVSVRGFKAAKSLTDWTGSCDPFVVIAIKRDGIKSQRQMTDVMYKNMEPDFDKKFMLTIDSEPPIKDIIVVKVKDKDTVKDVDLGVLRIPVQDIVDEIDASDEDVLVPAPYRVDQKKSNNKDLRVWLKFKLLKSPLPDFKDTHAFLLNLTVTLGSGLTVTVARPPLTIKAFVNKIVAPMQLVLEWKPPRSEDVPRARDYANLRDFKFALDGYADFPNVKSVSLAMLSKPTFDFKISALGNENLFALPFTDKLKQSFVVDLVYNLFPMCVYEMGASLTTAYSSKLKKTISKAEKGAGYGSVDTRLLMTVTKATIKKDAQEHITPKTKGSYCAIRYGHLEVDENEDLGVPAGEVLNSSLRQTHTRWGTFSPVISQAFVFSGVEVGRDGIHVQFMTREDKDPDRCIGFLKKSFKEFVNYYRLEADAPPRHVNLHMVDTKGRETGVIVQVLVQITVVNLKEERKLAEETGSKDWLSQTIDSNVTWSPLKATIDSVSPEGAFLKTSVDKDVPGTLLVEVVEARGLPSWGVGDGSVESEFELQFLERGQLKEKRQGPRAPLARTQVWNAIFAFDLMGGVSADDYKVSVRIRDPSRPQWGAGLRAGEAHVGELKRCHERVFESGEQGAVARVRIGPDEDGKTPLILMRMTFIPYDIKSEPTLIFTIHHAKNLPWRSGDSPADSYAPSRAKSAESLSAPNPRSTMKLNVHKIDRARLKAFEAKVQKEEAGSSSEDEEAEFDEDRTQSATLMMRDSIRRTNSQGKPRSLAATSQAIIHSNRLVNFAMSAAEERQKHPWAAGKGAGCFKLPWEITHQQFKTTMCKSTLNPEWCETFEVHLNRETLSGHINYEHELELAVFQVDPYSSSETMCGYINLVARDIYVKHYQDKEGTIVPVSLEAPEYYEADRKGLEAGGGVGGIDVKERKRLPPYSSLHVQFKFAGDWSAVSEVEDIKFEAAVKQFKLDKMAKMNAKMAEKVVKQTEKQKAAAEKTMEQHIDE